jgi:cephalosporin-C deacetylase-like acetyl esterase
MLVAIKGTYERRSPNPVPWLLQPPDETRGNVLQQTKDVQRAIDYVATRKDLNLDKLGYCGVSTVGFWGTIHAAIEPRIKVMLFIAGGFLPRRLPAEIEAVNYAPRVKVPALMLNGRYDSLFGVETSQLPLFNLLGTPAKDSVTYFVSPATFLPGRT